MNEKLQRSVLTQQIQKLDSEGTDYVKYYLSFIRLVEDRILTEKRWSSMQICQLVI